MSVSASFIHRSPQNVTQHRQTGGDGVCLNSPSPLGGRGVGGEGVVCVWYATQRNPSPRPNPSPPSGEGLMGPECIVQSLPVPQGAAFFAPLNGISAGSPVETL